jgi:DNA-binding SARP family transcriptional activator/TolB-like protein
MLTLRLFGGASIEGADGPLVGRVAQRRPLALLALLAMDRAPAMSRDRLLLLLAPESGTERARHLLRDTVYAVRAALGAEAIIAAGAELRLNRAAIACDVRDFEAALAAGDLAAAVALRTGPFLDGFHLRDAPDFEEWAAAERARLDGEYVRLLEALAAAALADGVPDAAARWWAQRLVLDPLNARATMSLMTALHAAGDVTGALRRAATHAALLRSELESPPDPAVQALAERLRREPVPEPALPASSAAFPAATGAAAGAASPAETAPAAATPAWTNAAAPHPPPARRRPSAPVALAAALAAAVALVLLLRGGAPEPELDPRRVAVAPLRNATGEAQLEVIGSMAADWITQGLTRSALLEVVPTATVLGSAHRQQPVGGRSADDTVPFRSVGEWTGAGTVVYGSYYREGDELIFQVQVADAQRGVIIRALEPVRAPLGSPLEGIEALRRHTLAALAPILDPRMSATAALSSRPPSYAAYSDYAAGLELFIAGELEKAGDNFERAAAADADYTLPLLWAALARWNSGDRVGGDALARQVAAAGARLPPFDEALLRSLLAWADGDYSAAYDAAARARRAAPGSGMAAAQVAVEALRLNRPGEARRVLASLDPDRGELRGWAYYWQDLAEALHLLGRHRDELRAAREARARHPDGVLPRLLEVRALAARGRVREVHALLDDALASTAAPGFGMLCRHAAQELIAHDRGTPATTVLDRCVAWSRSRLQAEPDNVAIGRELVRLLMMLGDDPDAARLLDATPPPAQSWHALDHLGQAALLAQRAGHPHRADAILLQMEERAIPLANGRDAWWRAAVAGARGDCDAAFDALRAGLSRGVAFGMGLHNAHELQPLRGCPGWNALVRPRG